MATYANQTTVSPDKSLADIRGTVERYKASEFMFGMNQDRAIIGFCMQSRRVKFVLTIPKITDNEITHDARGFWRQERSRKNTLEQLIRQRWRALFLVIKAKLEAVESGITTFEQEFLAHLVLPDGRTYGEFAVPQLEAAYKQGEMPTALPWLGENN